MTDAVTLRRRKAFKIAKDIGLTDDERHELAQYILRRDITTWAGLEAAQLDRLLDAMEGYELITTLMQLRPE